MPLPNPVLQHGANAEQDSSALMCVVCSDAVYILLGLTLVLDLCLTKLLLRAVTISQHHGIEHSPQEIAFE